MASQLLDHIHEHILDNGLKVISLQKDSSPIVSVQVWYKTGSINERNGIRGISHILEHMMFRGSKNVPSEDHSHRISDVGGHCNAFTSEDITAYVNSVPGEHLEMVLALESDRMQHITLDPALLAIERTVIIEEFHTYMNNPVAKAFLEFRQAMYANHPYATSPLGTRADISAVTAEDCRAYYNEWYTPDNAILVVVGDFKSTGELLRLCHQYFGDIKNGLSTRSHERQSPIPPPSFDKPQRMIRKVDFDVPMLILGYPAPSAMQTQALPIEIAQLAVSQGETSRLHHSIVREQSLAVMVGGVNLCLNRSGISLFFAAFTPDKSAARIEQAISQQIQTMTTEGLRDDEIEKIKNATLTSRIFELYSAEHICQRIGYAETVEGDWHMWVKRLDALQKLDNNTLRTTIQEYWKQSARQVLYLKPKRINPLLWGFAIFNRIVSLRPKGKKSV